MDIKQFILISTTALAIVVAPCRGDDLNRNYWPTEEWRISKAEKQGFDGNQIEMLDTYVRENLYLMTSLLIIRHGYIVFEKYYEGDKDTLRRLYSIPKSYISCLIGVLIQEGYLRSIEEKMVSFFPEYQSSDLNPDVNKITIKQLLTMSDGLSGTIALKSAFKQPLRNEPGKDFIYREIAAQVLSILITKTTGLKALDFGMKYLFEPLGISNISWSEISGFTNGADGLSLTARDAAKLGYLYLNNGIWDGKQIIASSWVKESTRKQIDIPESQGWTNEYGFYWWLRNTVGYDSYIAAGFGPQLVYVVPKLDLIIVLTTEDGRYPGPPYLPFIDELILPAIID